MFHPPLKAKTHFESSLIIQQTFTNQRTFQHINKIIRNNDNSITS